MHIIHVASTRLEGLVATMDKFRKQETTFNAEEAPYQYVHWPSCPQVAHGAPGLSPFVNMKSNMLLPVPTAGTAEFQMPPLGEYSVSIMRMYSVMSYGTQQ